MSIINPANSLAVRTTQATLKASKPLSDIGVLSCQSGDIREVGEKAKNNVTGNLKGVAVTTAGLGLSAGAATLVAKNEGAAKAIESGLDQFVTKSGIKENVNKIAKEPKVKELFNKIKNAPKGAKIAGAIGLAVTYLVSNAIFRKALKKDGKIEQKWEDKAKMQDLVG